MNANIAQWQCTGLPSRGRRFESAYSLKSLYGPVVDGTGFVTRLFFTRVGSNPTRGSSHIIL